MYNKVRPAVDSIVVNSKAKFWIFILLAMLVSLSNLLSEIDQILQFPEIFA